VLTKLIYITILMNKVLIFIFLIILLLTVFLCRKENFVILPSTINCNSRLDEDTGEFYCGDNNCCLLNPSGGFCNITNVNNSSLENDADGGSGGSADEISQEQMNYNYVINPNKVYCVDFCVNTYTKTNPNENNFGEFKDDNKLSSYVSSKCSECINNYYNRLKLLKNPYEEVSCTKQV
jgi:hypothetical protein